MKTKRPPAEPAEDEDLTKTDPTYCGPTVCEYAEIRITAINRQVYELAMERSKLYKLQRTYKDSNLLWSDLNDCPLPTDL